MSRLDQHVNVVRARMSISTFLRVLLWAMVGLIGLILLAILVARCAQLRLPREVIFVYVGVGVAIVLPIVYAIWRRPTPREAAVAIDERLALKEKFSTALYVRGVNDPFAAAAVKDAENAAKSVQLGDRFPIGIPLTPAVVLMCVGVVTLLVAWLMPQFDFFGVKARETARLEQNRLQVASAEHAAKQALAEIEAAPKSVAENEDMKLAKSELTKMLEHPGADPVQLAKKAKDALSDVDAIKERERIKETAQFAKARHELANLKDMAAPPPTETGVVADAHRDVANQDLISAAAKIEDVVNKFDKMSQEEKDKAAKQMKDLANAMQKQADDPNVQKQIQQQLQQAGMSQQMAQNVAKNMQQAANGDQGAAQQLRQMANQAIQQANQQNPGAGQAQQQAVANAIKQAMQQGQQQANQQANSQQMSQTMQGLAQSMAQAAQHGQSQGSQGQQATQRLAGGQQPGQQGQQPGQQQRQQAGQQSGQQAGQQPGQQAGAGQGQQQTAQQAMQQQVAQLQAMAQDAQAVGAAQQQAGGQQGQNSGQGAQAMAQGANQSQGQNPGQGNGQGNGQPRPNPNQAQANGQPGQGPGQEGHGGARPELVTVPFQVKQEFSQSQLIDSGKILASSFVKAPAERGSSHLDLSEVAESANKEAADEVEQDRIPRSAQKAVKDYFDTLKNSPPKN